MDKVDSKTAYKCKLAALLFLRCIRMGFEELQLWINPEGVAEFEDIILKLKKPDCEAVAFMLQLEDKNNAKNVPEGESLSQKVLSEYFKNIEKSVLKDLCSFSNIRVVLYTNNRASELEFLEKCSDTSLSFLNTNKNVETLYKFKRNPPESDLYLFVDQANGQQLDEQIIEEISNNFKLFSTNIEEIAENFTAYILEWYKGNLTCYFKKEDILYKLTELFLSPYTVNLTEKPFTLYKNEKQLIWNQIIVPHSVTVVSFSETILNYLIQYFSSEIQQRCKHIINNWEEQLTKDQEMLLDETPSHIFKNVTCPVDIYKSLWRMKIVPLLLKINKREHYETIINMLRFCSYSYKVIILFENIALPPRQKGINRFETLKDLNEEARNKILAQTVNIQGRPGAVLKNLVKDNIFQYIKCADILRILTSEFNIGNDFKHLPDYFIDRIIVKTVIKHEVLKNHDKEIFLMKGKFDVESLRNYEVIKAKNINLSDPNSMSGIIHIEDLNSYQVEQLKTRKKPVHILSCYDTNYFHLEYCSHFSESITENKIELLYPLKQETINTFLDKTTIIDAAPGMGKTTLIDYVARFSPTDLWVLKISLNEHQSYFKKQTCHNLKTVEEHLNYFFSVLCKNHSKLCKQVFQHFMALKKVVVLLDGFDEISCNEEVTDIIKSIHQNGYRICITTQSIMKQHLEETLKTFSDTIKAFNPKDQNDFLISYFNNVHNPLNKIRKSNQINEFTWQLLQAASINLSNRDAELIGNPLQTKLLAEAFSKKCEEFITDENSIEFNNFDLPFLYKSFVENKINTYMEKCSTRAELYEHITWFALHLIFSEKLSNISLNQFIKTYVSDKNIKQLGETIDICRAHRTIAEYLSAEWLIKNINATDKKIQSLAHNLIKSRFSQNNDLLFYIFDKIATKNHLLHQAILSKEYDKVENLINDNQNLINETDQIGRTVLHIIALNSSRFRLPYFQKDLLFSEDKQIKFVRETILNQSAVCTQPDMIGYTALDYALANSSLEAANVINEKIKARTIKAHLDLYFKSDLLSYCIEDFPALFKLLMFNFICRDLILTYIEEDCIIEDYIAELDLIDDAENILCEFEDKTALQLAQSEFGRGYSGYIQDYYSDLRFAIAFSSTTNVEKLLLEHSDINNQDVDGNTPLHYAVLHKKIESIYLLLNKGAIENLQNNDGDTPLHLAIWGYNFEIIKTLVTISTEDVAKKSKLNLKNNLGSTVLHLASGLGYKDIALLIIDKGGDINAKNNAGESPLHRSVDEGHKELAELIISKGCDINLKDNDGNTSFHLASKRGFTDIAKLLIVKKVQINAKNYQSETSLHLASVYNNKDVVELIIAEGGEINTKDKEGSTPLHCASKAGYTNIAELIIAKGGNINATNNKNETSLHLAVLQGHEELVGLIIGKGGDINAKDNKDETPLHIALNWGYKDITKLIINKGPDVNIKDSGGRTPIFAALSWGYKDIAELIIIKGCNVNDTSYEGKTLLYIAVLNGYKDMVELVIAKGGNVNAETDEGESPLHLASSLGLEDFVELIINKGGNINAKDKEGDTPLHLAALEGYEYIAKLIIANGGSINAKNDEGETPLHLASLHGYRDICELIIANEGDVNMKTNEGETALHIASSEGHQEVVELIISKGGEINATDNDGYTPLHLASVDGHKDITDLLIVKGGNLKAKDNKGRTPLNLALEFNHKEVAELLVLNEPEFNADSIT